MAGMIRSGTQVPAGGRCRRQAATEPVVPCPQIQRQPVDRPLILHEEPDVALDLDFVVPQRGGGHVDRERVARQEIQSARVGIVHGVLIDAAPGDVGARLEVVGAGHIRGRGLGRPPQIALRATDVRGPAPLARREVSFRNQLIHPYLRLVAPADVQFGHPGLDQPAVRQRRCPPHLRVVAQRHGGVTRRLRWNGRRGVEERIAGDVTLEVDPPLVARGQLVGQAEQPGVGELLPKGLLARMAKGDVVPEAVYRPRGLEELVRDVVIGLLVAVGREEPQLVLHDRSPERRVEVEVIPQPVGAPDQLQELGRAVVPLQGFRAIVGEHGAGEGVAPLLRNGVLDQAAHLHLRRGAAGLKTSARTSPRRSGATHF